MSQTLDLTQVPASDKLGQIQQAYAALSDEQTLVLVDQENFLPVVHQFLESEHTNLWTLLLKGKPRYEGCLTKLPQGSKPLRSIYGYMEKDHKRCDEVYARGEEAIQAGDKAQAQVALQSFIVGMKRHFDMEERILFPAFENATGMTMGPTQVMRMEHEQMKNLLQQLQDALDQANLDQAAALGDTMLVLMQQHNVKEENILYPMIDSHLMHETPGLVQACQKVDL